MSATPRLSTTHTHRVIRKNGFIQKLDDMTACGEIIQHETNVIIGTKGYWQIAGTGITKDGQPSRGMLLNRGDIWGRLTIGFAPAESLVKPESNEAPSCPSCLKAIASAPDKYGASNIRWWDGDYTPVSFMDAIAPRNRGRNDETSNRKNL